MLISVAIFLVLGVLHFVYTFWGPRLTPRDPAVQAMMSNASLILTPETTMWKAWLGFNASHSVGAILFGLVYGYLGLMHDELLFESPYLLLVGLAVICAFVILARLYWFSVPFLSLCVALACYAASIAVSRAFGG